MAKLKSIGKLASIATDVPNRPVVAPPPSKASGRPATALDRPTLFPQGPQMLGLGRKRTQKGPGMAPTDFEGSLPEWVWYYVSARLHDSPKDPRIGPFTGSPQGMWFFQVPELPGAPRQVGSSISDFVYVQAQGFVIVRIEGFYWHTAAPPAQQARDAYLTQHAANEGVRVERVEDGEFMGDPTGETAARLLAEILAGQSRIGAIHGGLAQPPRYADFGQG
jgi:hypothetical protein